MKKRILSLFLILAMLITMCPVTVFATDDTVYLSISDDDKYAEGKDGIIMAYQPVSLEDLATIRLEDYGLDGYIYDSNEDGKQDLTVLHLYLYAHEQYYDGDVETAFTVEGGAGSLYMTAFWGHDCNLNYYVNGVYPQKDAWGITADQLVLENGDFIDVAMFTSWSFNSDAYKGFHYFLDEDGDITHSYTATAGEALTAVLGRTAQGANYTTDLDPVNPSTYYDANYSTLPVYYGTELYASDATEAELNADGEAAITFDEAGTYYLWADGGCGQEAMTNDGSAPAVVSSPAYAKVTVEEAEEPEPTVYDVSLPEHEGYTVTGAATVTEGEDYTFTVTVADGWDGTNMVVKVNGETVTGTDGSYTVANVTSDLEITVTGVVEAVEPETYAVSIPTGEGYTVTGAATVTEGEDYTFTVAVADGWDGTNMIVKVNGEEVTGTDGSYTVENVASDLTITVEGVEEEQAEEVIEPTVVYTNGVQGSNWPYRNALVNTITIDGANVKKFTWTDSNTCEVQFVSSTPEDAVITFTFTKSGSFASRMSAKLNGTSIGTSGTVTLTDGAATAALYVDGVFSKGTKTFNLSVAEPNNLPTLADSSATGTTASIAAGEGYTLNLASLFTDADVNDTLSYNLAVNGADAAAITVGENGSYIYENNIAGAYTLVFTATDSKGDTSEDTYTVTLTITNSATTYDAAVNVPEGVEASFYAFGGYDDTGADICGEELTAEKNGSTYTVAVPENLDTICFRTAGGSGQAIAVSAETAVTLRKVNVSAADMFSNAVEATVSIADAEGHSVTLGTDGFVSAVGAAYTLTAAPANTKAYKTASSAQAIAADTEEICALVDYNNLKTVTTPTGAEAQLFLIGNYYYYSEVACAGTKDNGDGTDTHYFPGALGTAPIASTAIYRVTYEDYIVKAGYTSKNVTVTYTENDLKANARVDYAASSAANKVFADDSVLLNINAQNHLALDVNDTKTLKAYRTWELIPVSYNNWIVEPDFHFNVVWESEDGVVSLANKDNPMTGGESWQTLTANKEGTAIIEVTYDAVQLSGGQYDGAYGASDPARTGLVVVTVGGADNSVVFGIDGFASSGIKGSKNVSYNANAKKNWDAEFDTLYFTGESGELNFTPTAGSEISAVAVSHDKGATWQTLTAADGVYTAEIVSGNNILRVTTANGTAYQVVRGDQVTVTVTEQNTEDDNDDIEAGETVRVTLDGMHTPIPKIAGNYNPGYGSNSAGYSSVHMNYTFEGSAVYGPGTQYTFGTTANYIDVTIPADAAGSVSLTDGYIGLGVIGLTSFTDGGDSHRNIPDSGCSTRDSQSTWHTRSILPEIMIELAAAADDQAAADAVEAKIAAIGTITLESETAINEARTAYDALTDAQKALVENYETLTAAEDALAALKAAAAADQAAADAVEEKIAAIGTVTLESETAIDEARTAYDALTDAQKALVENYETLTAAEAALAALKTPAKDWKTVMNTTKAFLTAQVEETAPVVSTFKGEWVVLGLARSGVSTDSDYFDVYYDNVLSYVSEKIDADTGRLHAQKSTDNSRVIVALSSIGKDAADVGGYNLLKGLTDTDYVKNQGINGPVWALIALDTADYEIPTNADSSKQVTREWLVDYILSKQLPNGGWALSGSTPDDMTPMAIQALAPYYSGNEAVKTAVDKALSIMPEMSATTETYAQMITALSALGIDCETDERFADVMDKMLTFALEDGSFQKGLGSGTNQMSTEQAFYAMVAYDRFKSGKTSLYDMSDLADLYNITVIEPAHGAIKVASSAKAGASVTVTVDPAAGYVLDQLYIGGTLTAVSDNKATFTMSNSDVVISASFKLSENASGELNDAMAALTNDDVKDADKEAYELLRELEEAFDALTAAQQEALRATDAYKNYEAALEKFAEELDELKKVAEDDLDDLLADYDEDDYTEKNWKKIKNIYSDALDALEDALYAEELEEILEDAEEDMEDVPTGGALEVTFRLIGDSKHDNGVSDHVEYITWIETTEYTLEAGSTMYDLFIMAIDDYDLNQKGAKNNYVESIQAPDVLGGFWLGEFDNGRNSGWMYTIDGKHPGTGLVYQKLEDGDEVIWHYVDDYTKEERNSKSQYYERWLEAKDISPEKYVNRTVENILIVGKHGTVTPELDADDIGRDITFRFIPDEGYVVENVIIDGKSKGAIESYTYDDLSIDSRIEVTFVLAGQQTQRFTDVAPEAWYYDEVEYVAANGLFSGTGDGSTFSPGMTMSRAMMVTVLHNMAENPYAYGTNVFTDVANGVWYTDAVRWGTMTGVVSGYPGNLFGTNDDVTREQIAVFLYNYAKCMGYDVSSYASLTSFADDESVSTYAKTAMEWAVAEGIISGRTGNKLAAKSNASRAEVAAMVYNFMENIAQ